MEIDNLLEKEIKVIVNKYVPIGTDTLLHVDRRKATVSMIKKIISDDAVPYNKMVVHYMAKNWYNLLCSRSQTLN